MTRSGRGDDVDAHAARAKLRSPLGRDALVRLTSSALAELDLGRRVERALRREVVPSGIVAIGKAAPAMARGALARFGGEVERCLVVAPDGTDVGGLSEAASFAQRTGHRPFVETLRADHPTPGARSVRAGERILQRVTELAKHPSPLLVLVSGGASALACAPIDGCSLARKRAIARALLVSGATIQEINVVRKHLSRLKGGGLLRAASPARVLTLVASDVVAGHVSDVGSGPSVPDDSTVADARRILRRFAPRFADEPLRTTLGPRTPAALRSRARVLASPEELARLVARALRERGFVVRVLPAAQTSVTVLRDEYLTHAAAMKPGTALVRAAEPSIEVANRPGRGGRSTHLAASVAQGLPRGLSFLALATDGVDGSSGTGGAVVDGTTAARIAKRFGADALRQALAGFDTGPLLSEIGAALPERPSGHNLADLHVLVRA